MDSCQSALQLRRALALVVAAVKGFKIDFPNMRQEATARRIGRKEGRKEGGKKGRKEGSTKEGQEGRKEGRREGRKEGSKGPYFCSHLRWNPLETLAAKYFC